MITKTDVIIIGAGAAGLAAAGFIKNKSVAVIERNEKPGKKLYITGKGRCNITNYCSPEEFLNNVVTNPKFLFSCIYGFTPADTVERLNSYGLPTKVERGNRVFPVSDKSSDVIKILYIHCQKKGVQFYFNERVVSISNLSGIFTVKSEKNSYESEILILATGGKTYPSTGSTGDGYVFSTKLGHKLIEPKPSLVNMLTKQNVSSLAGLTLKNVSVKLKTDSTTFTEFGELLFTHDGVSGPTVLRLSAYASRAKLPAQLFIDFKPALNEETLDKRILKDFAENSNKQLKNSLDKLLPKALILPVLLQSGLQEDKKVNVLSKSERAKLVKTIKEFCLNIVSFGGFESAVITSGGIDTKQINPNTMQSKIVKNLYLAGEIIDVDALTGGFNLQIAFSTAYAAAASINQGD